MRKDAKRYTDTEGWGWGRWRGLDLKPYGKDRRFVNECTDCHRPMRGNDYVYTLPITDARVKGNDVVNNIAAALPRACLTNRSHGTRSRCTSIHRSAQWRRCTEMTRRCRLYRRVAPLKSAEQRDRRIRRARCWQSLHGRNATTRTGSGHESPGYRYPWNSWKLRPADRRTTVVSPARASPRITPVLRPRSEQASRWDSLPRNCRSASRAAAAYGRYAGGSGLRFWNCLWCQ